MSGNAPAGAGRAVWKARDAADRETSHHAGLSTSRDEAVRTQYESSVAAADYAAAQGGWGRYARYHHSRLYVVDQVLRGCPGGDLLDVGCGPGILVRHLLDTRDGDFRITACDRSQAMIDAVAQRVADADGVRLTVGRIENMPYSDGRFDIALVLGVLEYTDCATGVREIARVVRPGLMVVVTMLNPASPYRLFGLPRVFRTVELCYFMLRAVRLDIRCGPRAGFGSPMLSEAAADYRRFQYSGQYLVLLCSVSDRRCGAPAHSSRPQKRIRLAHCRSSTRCGPGIAAGSAQPLSQ